MKRTLTHLFAFLLVFISIHSHGQELMANVTIDATQIPNIQTSVVTDMKQTISRFLNDRKWSNDEYLTEEKIRCNFSIMLTSGNSANASYTATLQVQATRPVYGTSYESITLNFFDKNFNFDLNMGQPIIYNDNMFTTDLSSMLAFYANIILAVDYDSFSKLGGQPFIEKANTIANNAVQAGGGWATSGDPNNRYALIYNLNSQLLLPFRNQFYIYHREVLDNYLKDPDKERLKIIEVLKTIKEVNKLVPYSILLRTFFLSKRDELINIFKDSKNAELKTQAFNLLRELDALNTERYSTITK
ncbi:DUF4835 family protein [uncultured Cytophaga sp.]|uniref:type IX secretion system protein PorD n=1 Tax=uncultured Cytophaga sp. TaxID=160238 RepID=UPI00260BA55F|nr:DUF4835 family protein [uncultured Cytophaga sp.]